MPPPTALSGRPWPKGVLPRTATAGRGNRPRFGCADRRSAPPTRAIEKTGQPGELLACGGVIHPAWDGMGPFDDASAAVLLGNDGRPETPGVLGDAQLGQRDRDRIDRTCPRGPGEWLQRADGRLGQDRAVDVAQTAGIPEICLRARPESASVGPVGAEERPVVVRGAQASGNDVPMAAVLRVGGVVRVRPAGRGSCPGRASSGCSRPCRRSRVVGWTTLDLSAHG